MAAPGRRYVSRGGEKLAAALERFDLAIAGARVLDAGCSTGGFTDALLESGAGHVIAVDVAYGLLDWRLRNDPRVEVHERTNVRTLSLDTIREPVTLIVADLAFIDLRKVRDAFEAVSTPDADAVLLVKPQFELPRNRVPRGGVVTDSDAWREALGLVAGASRAAGWRLVDACASPLAGPKGNREFLVHLNRSAGVDAGDERLDVAIREAP